MIHSEVCMCALPQQANNTCASSTKCMRLFTYSQSACMQNFYSTQAVHRQHIPKRRYVYVRCLVAAYACMPSSHAHLFCYQRESIHCAPTMISRIRVCALVSLESRKWKSIHRCEHWDDRTPNIKDQTRTFAIMLVDVRSWLLSACISDGSAYSLSVSRSI